MLIEKRVDAIVLATSGGNEETIYKIKEAEVPIILIDRKLENEAVDFDLVEEDNIDGSYQLTKYLIEQGHKRIGVVNGPLNVSTGKERYLGYENAMNEHEVELNPDLVFNGHFTQEDGIEAVAHFLIELLSRRQQFYLLITQ